ncbi:MAG: methyltransferase [Clostridiales bacterium]|nr:methyltransferase [Clostridiales bacterium]
MTDPDNLTLDNIGRRDFILYQQKDGFRFGTDSVLLAWFAASFARKDKGGAYRSTSFLELGSGCGGAAMCVAARLPDCTIDCCEIMDVPCDVLRLNISANGVEDRVRAFNCDIRSFPGEIKQRQYDVVFSNPPFFNAQNNVRTDPAKSSGEKLAGRFEENGGLEDFLRASKSRVIPSTGHIIMVMKADRLTEVMSLMDNMNISPTRLLPVHPKQGREASSILIAGRVGNNRSKIRILPPLFLDDADRMNGIYEGEHKDCFI